MPTKIVRIKRNKRPTSPTDLLPPCHPIDEVLSVQDTVDDLSGYTSISRLGSKLNFSTGGAIEGAIKLLPGCKSSDSEAAKQFLSIYGRENLVVCDRIMWVFNKLTGMWTFSPSDIKNIVTRQGNQLTICETKEVKSKNGGSETETVITKMFQYACVSTLTKGMLDKLPCFVDTNNAWKREKFGSDRFKVLFANGIYDFKTRKFEEEANPNIVFTSSCSFSFDLSSRDDEAIREVKKVLFDAMGNKESSDTLLHELMRAFVGDFARKKIVFGLGPTNSGKSGMMKFIMYCTGGLAGTFNGDSILQRRDGCEAARENSWVCDIADKRFGFSSEIKVPLDEVSAKTCAINGNMLKRAASGGADVINARGAYGRERNYINKSTLFIFANDLPRINPADDAIRERAIVVEWKLSYVDDPKEEFERKKDEDIIQRISTPKHACAFIWIIDEFEKWREQGFKNPVLPEVCLRGKDEIAPILNLKELLEQKYLITKNLDDHVLARDLIEFLSKECNVPGGPSKIGRELSLLGFEKKSARINKKPETVRTGLKLKPENETHVEL